MQPSKWDLILEQRPQPIIEHLLDEAARLFAKDLSLWPPPVEAFDAHSGSALEALLADEPPRPSPALYRAAFTLARFDLGREVEAADDYVRNQRWLGEGLSVKDRGMLLFLSRYLTEQVLALGEATQGRVNRARMLQVLERAERAFFASSQTP